MDRAQAYSIQGVIGAIIITSALVLGLQAVSIQPFTGDSPGTGVDTKVQLEDTLDIIEDRNGLKTGVLCLGRGSTTPSPGVISTNPEVSPVGEVLNSTASRTASYNIYVVHNDSNGNIREVPVGPEDNVTSSAVSVTREVVIFDSDPVYEINQTSLACEPDSGYRNVSDAEQQGEIYLDNKNEDSDIFQVVQIKVVAW
jgi:hypothetical protein